MRDSDILKKMHRTLERCTGAVTYTAGPHEIEYATAPISAHIFAKTISAPYDKNSDPFSFANTCESVFKNDIPCIVIPGSVFDIYGTRHGRGGGWYDRFLSRIPKKWLRIGIIGSTKFSLEELERKSWDEPVDWILVCNTATSSWEAYEAMVKRN